MALRQIVITSERDAWTHVQRIAGKLRDKDYTIHYARESGIMLDAIADTMLKQLSDGVHTNPKRRRR